MTKTASPKPVALEAITIDLSKLVIADLETLDKASRNELPVKEMLDLLDRVVIGGARHLPLEAMATIVEKLQSEMQKTANPQ